MSSNLQHGNQSRIDLFPKNKMVSRHTDAPKSSKENTSIVATKRVIQLQLGFQRSG